MLEHEHTHTHADHEHHHHDHPIKLWIPATIMGSALLLSSIILCWGLYHAGSANLDKVYGVATSQTPVPTQQAQAQAQPAATPVPGTPVKIADRSDQPTLGNKNAKVTVVEFGDFQCPFCKQFYQNTFDQIKKSYIDSGKIKYVFRHFPLTQIHVNAQISGVAAECANQQGKFWDYHNLLYTSGQSDGTGLASADLKKYADQLGLNKGTLGFGSNKFNSCLDGNATLATVNADEQVGSSAGVTGTPSFFINGQIIVGAQPFSAFQTAIDAALAKS